MAGISPGAGASRARLAGAAVSRRHGVGGEVGPLAVEVIRDHDFHPPDDVRLFPMPAPGVLRLDDSMFVAMVRYGDIVVWHYGGDDPIRGGPLGALHRRRGHREGQDGVRDRVGHLVQRDEIDVGVRIAGRVIARVERDASGAAPLGRLARGWASPASRPPCGFHGPGGGGGGSAGRGIRQPHNLHFLARSSSRRARRPAPDKK